MLGLIKLKKFFCMRKDHCADERVQNYLRIAVLPEHTSLKFCNKTKTNLLKVPPAFRALKS